MRKEAVSLLGLAALILSIPLPYLTVKENRVAEGVRFTLAGVPGRTALVVGVAVVALLAAFILIPRLRQFLTARAVISSLAPALFLLLLQTGARDAMGALGFVAGRAGTGVGFWAGVVGAYMVLYDSLRRAERGRLAKGAIGVGCLAAISLALIVGPAGALGIVQEYANRTERFWREVGAHLTLSGVSVLGATVIGVPLGILAFRSRRAEKPVFTITNGLQTIPSLALFGLLIAPLAFLSHRFPFLRSIGIRGVGNSPAIIALVLYGLLPIVRNTMIGLTSIDRGVVDAGRGMGMSRRELLWLVQTPIALPIILTGIRITAVQTIGNAAVAALIGARGLGNYVFQGLGQAAPDLIVLGVIPIVVLAILVDRAMDAAVRLLSPGIRARSAQ